MSTLLPQHVFARKSCRMLTSLVFIVVLGHQSRRTPRRTTARTAWHARAAGTAVSCVQGKHAVAATLEHARRTRNGLDGLCRAPVLRNHQIQIAPSTE